MSASPVAIIAQSIDVGAVVSGPAKLALLVKGSDGEQYQIALDEQQVRVLTEKLAKASE